MSRVIAITGASAGIGRATALRVARDGASVAICARRRDRLEDVAAEIEKAGGRAFSFVADVTEEDDMDVFVRRTVEQFGHLDVMMCNAGFGIYGAIDEITPAQMKKLMDINYFGTYYAARAALRVFRRQKQGHLIVVSSIAGKRGVPFMGAYSATKFAPYPAFATHDPAMHARALEWAKEKGIGQDKYEFQLLYGIRRDLQQQLVANGSRVRIYIPFGREWFPYFMRRLGERPANVRSVVSSVIDERAAGRFA